LLLAPESGEETRNRLARLARDARSEAEDQVEEWGGQARRQVARRRRKVRRAMRRAGESLEDVRDRFTP
jgi:gas vesicle protein